MIGVFHSCTLLPICLVMPRPIQSRVLCYFSFIQFPQISKQTAITHFKIWANLFPVWTYSGQCHYSGSKYNMFEVWRWSGGWRWPSRWARKLLRAAEWERKEDASQQARQLKMSGSGASNSRLTHGVGLHRSRGWAWRLWSLWYLLQQIGSKTDTTHRDTPEPQQPYLFHLSVCYYKVFSEWGEMEFT